jgi:hypothetical protein
MLLTSLILLVSATAITGPTDRPVPAGPKVITIQTTDGNQVQFLLSGAFLENILVKVAGVEFSAHLQQCTAIHTVDFGSVGLMATRGSGRTSPIVLTFMARHTPQSAPPVTSTYRISFLTSGVEERSRSVHTALATEGSERFCSP